MIKCLLIYLWIYIGLFYMIEAGDDDEHVHIKLHMSSGQRKRAQIHQHSHQHHKKRHAPASSHHHHQHHQYHQPPPTNTKNLSQDSPHNYLTGMTATSSSLLLPQNHVFQSTHNTKKFPSSSQFNLHEGGQLLNIEGDVVYEQGNIGGEAVVSADTDSSELMTIPSYLTKNFALFPQPTTTYETEIIPHDFEGFNVASEGLDGLEDIEEDNEITAATGKGKGSLESLILAEQMESYQRHKPSSSLLSSSSSSAKTIKNEQLLQQLLQQQHNEQPEIMNAAAYKSAKYRGNKYKAEKNYHSEDDMTEAMMYSSSAVGKRHNPAQSVNRPSEDGTDSGDTKALTVDDIWSQLQQQYLNKYTPQAQPLRSADSEEHLVTTMSTKTKPKRKRNTKRQRYAKPPTTASYSTSWPAKPLSYTNNIHHSKHHSQPFAQQQHYYGDIHSLPSASAFSSASLSFHRDTDLFAKRPFTKLNAHNDEDDAAETEEELVAEFDEATGDDDFDAYGDESFEESVYQRGKKFSGHTAYGQHNPFNNHDLYGSYSTPVTATVATNAQPATYHPNLVSATLPSFSSSTTNSFLPTISHPSTSYQWRTQQQNYPASYQTYHLQHQQQQPQWTAGEQYAQQQQQPTALRLSKTTISQTPNTITSSKFTPTQSNDFTLSSSASSAAKSTVQPPARYKKRKNRIKPKRNRIIVI